MKPTCVQSCKGLCAALEVAERHEEEAVKEYRQYAAGCDYPDVKAILEDLVEEREQWLVILRQKREALAVRFQMIDKINESFS
jgi:rubrerythrin